MYMIYLDLSKSNWFYLGKGSTRFYPNWFPRKTAISYVVVRRGVVHHSVNWTFGSVWVQNFCFLLSRTGKHRCWLEDLGRLFAMRFTSFFRGKDLGVVDFFYETWNWLHLAHSRDFRCIKLDKFSRLCTDSCFFGSLIQILLWYLWL